MTPLLLFIPIFVMLTLGIEHLLTMYDGLIDPYDPYEGLS